MNPLMNSVGSNAEGKLNCINAVVITHEKPVITPITGFFIFAKRTESARFSVFRGENQKFSPAPIDPQRLLKSPPSGRASPVSIACAEVILDL